MWKQNNIILEGLLFRPYLVSSRLTSNRNIVSLLYEGEINTAFLQTDLNNFFIPQRKTFDNNLTFQLF